MKKTIGIIVCMLIIVSTFSVSSYAEEGTNVINIEKAKKIAILHVAGDMQKSSQETWEKGVAISNTITMYNLEDEPSCYMFELEDKDGKPSGYIVIGAKKDYYPVIEFSTTDVAFVKKAEEKIKNDMLAKENKNLINSKYYYLGGIDYIAELEDEIGNSYLYDISSKNIKNINKKHIKVLVEKNKQNKKTIQKEKHNKEAWGKWEKILLDGGNPPSSGGAITNPGAYESGYDSLYSDNVPYYYRAYNSMGKFSSRFPSLSNHCGPTVASNIMLYWYYRDSSKYNALYDGNQWYDSFMDELHPDIYCPTHDTNHINDLETGIESYFNRRNIGVNTDIDSWVWWSDIKGEIQANYPLIVLTKGHYLYQNHYVLALGYKDYVYEHWYGDDHSRYLRIYDGWDSTGYPNRYIHTEVGVDDLSIVQIRPE